MKLIYTGDFKRLKEFGYTKFQNNFLNQYYKIHSYYPFYRIEIDVEDREITKWLDEGMYQIEREILEEDIDDLIQAGLVKKEE